jgi:pSer/pThr/pTyr-binding forkhead associated (FHA) protein
VARDFERPTVLVGRNPHADLVPGHPLVGLRHAYLQLVEGRLFATDLGSREGLHWDGVPRRDGWIDRSRPVQLGVTTIRVVEGDRAGDWGPGPGPTSRRYKSSRSLPRAVLEMRGSGEEMRRLPLDRVLTLVGGSQHSHVRLPGPGISRFVCGLLRTSVGVWAVDLLSSQGVAVNGAICRQVWLEDGDVLRIGALAVRLTYGEFTEPPRADTPTQLASPIFGPGARLVEPRSTPAGPDRPARGTTWPSGCSWASASTPAGPDRPARGHCSSRRPCGRCLRERVRALTWRRRPSGRPSFC